MERLVRSSRDPGSFVFSNRFRPYCENVLTDEVKDLSTKLIQLLMKFQDRLHNKDPDKARMKRRLVFGLRECIKHAGLKKVKVRR